MFMRLLETTGGERSAGFSKNLKKSSYTMPRFQYFTRSISRWKVRAHKRRSISFRRQYYWHILLLSAFSFPLSAQFMPKDQKQSGTIQLNIPNAERRNLKLFAAGTALSFVSGFSYGAREVVQHKPWRIPSDWNQQWWNTEKSWTNKYFQNSVSEGRTRVPVMFTDAYHLSGTIHRWSAAGAGICIGANTNNWKSWKHLALNVLWNCLAFQAGFTMTYRSGAIFPR